MRKVCTRDSQTLRDFARCRQGQKPILIGLSVLVLMAATTNGPALAQDRATTPPQAIELHAKISPHHYNINRDRLSGHHGVVWAGGGAASKALLVIEESDREGAQCIRNLGGRPGNNLTPAAWLEVGNPASPEPDKRVLGSPVEVSVTWPGAARTYALSEIFDGETSQTVDLRFGGFEDLINYWNSGCVICMYSCPSGKISNHAFTLRDQARGRHDFRAREDLLPSDGSPATVTIRLRQE
ncbi:MAG: YdjY domain-containing protein [bacterium]